MPWYLWVLFLPTHLLAFVQAASFAAGGRAGKAARSDAVLQLPSGRALSTRLSPRDSPLGACWPLRRRPAPRRAPVAPPAAWSRPAGTGCAARSASSPPVGLKCVQCRCEQQRGHPLQALVVQLNQRRRHLHGNMHRYLRRDVKGRPPKQTDRSAAVTASCAAAAAPFAAAAK